MPNISAITDEQVIAAAAELTGRAKPVTGWTLRTVIGSGRADRLAAMWEGLKESTDAVQTIEPPVALPPAVADNLTAAQERLTTELRAAFSGAWKAASELAGQRVREEIATARARVVQLEDDSTEAARLLEDADARYAVLADELERERLARAGDAHVAAVDVAAAKQAEATARGEEQATRVMMERLQATLGELVQRLPAQPIPFEVPAVIAARRGPGRPPRPAVQEA